MGEGKRYAVICDPDSPRNGWWFDIGKPSGNVYHQRGERSTTYAWNGRYERRDDGMSARVYTPVADDAKGDV